MPDAQNPRDSEQQKMDEIVERRRALYKGVSRFPAAWIWVVIVGLLFFWFVGWGWGEWGGWWFGRARAAVIEPISGSNAAILATKDKALDVGETFFLHDVPVQRVVNNSVFWIGPNGNELTLLVLNGSTYDAKGHPITQGQHITVNGMVKKAPAPNVAQQNWNLSAQDTQTLARQQAYLQATSVQPISKPNPYASNPH